MELTLEQIEEFKKIHKPYGGLNEYTEEQIREIANGVANYYRTLFAIYQRMKHEEQKHDKQRKSHQQPDVS